MSQTLLHTKYASYEAQLPELSPEAALQRQYLNTLRPPEFARDIVASTADGENPDNPTPIGDQFFEVVTEDGRGIMSFIASRPIEKGKTRYEDIEEIFKVKPGELGNVDDYYRYFSDAMKGSFNPDTMLLVALKFARSVDPINDSMLRYGNNDYRSGEPAEYPSDPVGAYDAEDAFDKLLADVCPNAVIIHDRGNSESSQGMDRRLRWSHALMELELKGMIAEGRIQNAGSYQYDNRWRPRLLNPEDGPDGWRFEWYIPENPLVNRWPLGMYDPTQTDFDMYGPPPSVLRFIHKYSVKEGDAAYYRRARLSIALDDDDPQGSRVTKGLGFDEQGATRLQRAYARWRNAKEFTGWLATKDFGIQVIYGATHDAATNFRFAEHLDTLRRIDVARGIHYDKPR